VCVIVCVDLHIAASGSTRNLPTLNSRTRSLRAWSGPGCLKVVEMQGVVDPETIYTKQNCIGT